MPLWPTTSNCSCWINDFEKLDELQYSSCLIPSTTEGCIPKYLTFINFFYILHFHCHTFCIFMLYIQFLWVFWICNECLWIFKIPICCNILLFFILTCVYCFIAKLSSSYMFLNFEKSFCSFVLTSLAIKIFLMSWFLLYIYCAVDG